MMDSTAARSSGGLMSTRLKLSLPTPLAVALRMASSDAGTAPERLSHRLAFVETVLRFLVAVQDGERALLQLPRPKEAEALIKRIDRPTLGLWAKAAQALARTLAEVPTRPLPPTGGGLLPSDTADRFLTAASTLIDVRNEVAHSASLAGLTPSKAQGILDDTRPAFVQLVQGLHSLCELMLVVATESRTGLTGDHFCRVSLHRGEHPEVHERVETGCLLPLYQPVLIAGDGAIIWLFPWMACSHDRGLHHVLLLHHCSAQEPFYDATDIGQAIPAHKTALAREKLPEDLPKAWFKKFPQSSLSPRFQPAAVALLARLLPVDRPPSIRNLRPIELLGRGGTGTVWLVEDPDRGCQRLALKILHPLLASRPEHTRRVAREHSILRDLQIPGVVRVEETFQHPDHGPCLLMEWVQGESLAVVVSQGPMPAHRAIGLVAGLLDTLAVVHKRGIIHRDIKPSNVLLRDGKPMLIDFGVAWADDDERLTVTADIVGTLAYAAPEQREGRRATAAADLYACGRLLEELLAGPARDKQRRMDGPLGPVIRRALQADPKERFRDAQEMGAALREAMNGGPPRCALDPGELLPGALRALEILDEVEPGLFVLRAATRTGEAAAVFAPGPEGSSQARFRRLIDEADPTLFRQHLRSRLQETEDGIPFVELWADNPLAAARALLTPTPRRRRGSGDGAQSQATPRTDPPPAPAPAPAADDKASADAPGSSKTAPAAKGDMSSSDMVAIGLGALAMGALAGHALTNVARKPAGSRTAPPTDGAAQPAQPNAARPPRRGSGKAPGLFGALVGALLKSGAEKVHPAAKTRHERVHHAALLLLALEANVGELELTTADWKRAWSMWMGGLVVLFERSPGPHAYAQPLLQEDPNWPAFLAAGQELSRVAEPPHPDDPRIRGLQIALAEAFRRSGSRQPTGKPRSCAVLRQKDGGVQIRREPANTGWQIVSLLDPE